MEGGLVLALGELTILLRDDRIELFGPFSGPDSPEVPGTRQGLRDLARTDEFGRYRPLTGARSLRRGWRTHFGTLAEFSDAVSEVYPLALEHNAQWEAMALRVVPLDQVLQRQTSRYAGAKELDEHGRLVARQVLCARCVRVPVWAGPQPQGTPLGEGAVACPEACSVMVSLCREAAAWQEIPPAQQEPDPTLPFAAFEQPGNEVREAYLRTRYPSRHE